jgi:hypothetical protein
VGTEESRWVRRMSGQGRCLVCSDFDMTSIRVLLFLACLILIGCAGSPHVEPAESVAIASHRGEGLEP